MALSSAELEAGRRLWSSHAPGMAAVTPPLGSQSGLVPRLSEGIQTQEPWRSGASESRPGGQGRAALGVCMRGMQRNNVNPCNQSISVQVSYWRWLQTPVVGCSDGGAFRERLYNALSSL